MFLSKPRLPLHLLLTNLFILVNTIKAASIPRRDPSSLINTRHPKPEPLPAATSNSPGRLTISGHGVVAVPIPPTGERVHVDVTSSPTDEHATSETKGGLDPDSDPDSDSEYIKLVKVGDTTFQIIGTELTITDDRDEPSRPGTAVGNGGNNNINDKEGGISDQKLTSDQLAAMEFAKTAEEIMAGKDRVLGGTARPGGVDSGLGPAQDHEQPLGMGQRRRQIRRLAYSI